jgi:hypothetical protein
MGIWTSQKNLFLESSDISIYDSHQKTVVLQQWPMTGRFKKNYAQCTDIALQGSIFVQPAPNFSRAGQQKFSHSTVYR